MIIAPGTICWNKINANGEAYFRNEIYFFYKGDIKKYKKTYPHPLDFSYVENKANFERDKKYFKTGSNNSPVVTLNGISIGIEICLDNAYKHLDSKTCHKPYQVKSKKKEQPRIDVHLLVADGIKRPNLIGRSNLLFFKVERTSKYKTQIGTVCPTRKAKNQERIAVDEWSSVSLSKTLTYYKK